MLSVVILAALWAWPSALFLPVILGQDTGTLRLASVAITLGIGILLTWFARSAVLHGPKRLHVSIMLGLVVASVVVIPLYYVLVSRGTLQGLGGDRGQALDIALERILAGQYPYSALTYDGGQITPLPGGLLLAAPSYLALGTSYFMTVYVTPITAWLVYRVNRPAGAILAASVVMAPAFWADALSSGDLVTTSLLAFAVAANCLRAGRAGGPPAYWWAVVLGVVGATRITSIMIAALALAIMVALGKARMGVRQLLITIASFLAVSLPLYLINPAEFSPLHTASFIQGAMGTLLAVLLVAGVLVALLTLPRVRVIPTHVSLAVAVTVTSIGLTAVPLVVNPNPETLFTTGYAVLALTAPIAVALAAPSRMSRAAPRGAGSLR